MKMMILKKKKKKKKKKKTDIWRSVLHSKADFSFKHRRAISLALS